MEPKNFLRTEKPRPEKLNAAASYEELEATIPQVAAMKGFDQRSDFHSLTLDEHVKRVVHNLEQDSFIQGLPPKLQDLIFLAGKLHDLGKIHPEGMQVHPKDPEKRQYKKHERYSEQMVNELLPAYFDLAPEQVHFVASLVGMHASTLRLISTFEQNNEPTRKQLKTYEHLFDEIHSLPINLDDETKARIVFAFNRADKGGGYNDESDMTDEKVQNIKQKADQQIRVLREMERAIPAFLEAIQARKAGDQKAGIEMREDGEYYYNNKP